VENQKNEFLKVVEEFRRKETSHKSALENLQAEINQREANIAHLNNAVKDKDVLMAEMNALKEKLASKEMAVDKLDREVKPLMEKMMMYKNDLTITLNKVKDLEGVYNKAVNENERLTNDLNVVTTKYNRASAMCDAERKKKEELDGLAQTASSSLKEKESAIRDINSALNQLQKDYNRISSMYESEKKRKEEVYSLAQTSSLALRDKEEEIKKLTISFNQAQRDYNRASAMCDAERKKKEELDGLAQTSTSALREKEEEVKKLADSFKQAQKDYNRVRNMYENEKKKKEEFRVLAQNSSSVLKETEEEIKQLTASLAQAQKDYARMNNMYEDEKEKKENLNMLAQTSSLALKEKEEDVKKLNRIKENFEVELKKLNNCLAKGEQGFYYKIEILKKEVQEKDNINEDLQRKVNQYSSQSEINANEFLKIGKVAENLKVEIFDKTEALKTKEKEAKELKDEMALLNSRITEGDRSEKELEVSRHKDEIIDNLNRKIAILNKEMKN